MLYLITLPPPLQQGLYDVQSVSPKKAGKLINHHAARGDLVSRITFPATASVLSEIGRVRVEWYEKAPLMGAVQDGDTLIQAKLRTGAIAGSRLSVDDLEFLLIRYTE